MKISKQARREAKGIFRACVVNDVIDDGRVRKAVAQLVEKRPRGYLSILAHLHRLIRLDIHRRTARVESAIPISAELETEIREKLTGIYGPGLTLVFSQNDGLLGGLRVQVGSDVYDGTVQTRLAQLEQSF